MSFMKKSEIEATLPRAVIGCGVQGVECLAMSVSGMPGAWSVHWAKLGTLGDSDFATNLSRAAGRTHLWTPPTEEGAAQMSFAGGIDLPMVGGKKLGRPECIAALQTQVHGRMEQVAAPIVIRGLEIKDSDEESSHWVGGGALRERISLDYKNWRKRMGIINPHIASSSMAIANLYMALYPADTIKTVPLRLIVLEGRQTTHGVLMDNWRFLDALEYRMMEGQTLDAPLVKQWAEYAASRHSREDSPIPIVISLKGEAPFDCEAWSPFESAAVKMSTGVRELINDNHDLSAMAFGMALQGGI